LSRHKQGPAQLEEVERRATLFRLSILYCEAAPRGVLRLWKKKSIKEVAQQFETEVR